MNILMAVHHFPPRYRSGAEWEAYRISKQLIYRGYSVKVVCVEHIDQGPKSGVLWKDEIYDEIPVRRLSMNIYRYPKPNQWEYNNAWIGEHLHTYFLEFKPDIFHLVSGYLFTGSALVEAKKARIPTIVCLMDFYFLCRRLSLLRSDGKLSLIPTNPEACVQCIGEEKRKFKLLGKVMPGLMRIYWKSQRRTVREYIYRKEFLIKWLNEADLIISRSEFLRKIYIQEGIHPEKIVFQRQGLELNNVTAFCKKVSNQLRVAYIGQISELKGIHLLIQAVKNLKTSNVLVKIYGDVSLFPSYTRKLLELAGNDERIQFAGVFLPKDLNQIYEDIDVIVVPSMWYENSPNVILEAFARKTPVIASNLGGMAELVEHGKNGLLFEPSSSDSLSEQLKILLEDKTLLPSLVEGIRPVKSLSQEIDELEIMYSDLLNKSNIAL